MADPWLFALTDAADALLGWQEVLPTGQDNSPLLAQDLPPGDRAAVAENLAGLTAGLPNQPDHTNSHLLSLGEYLTAYLFTWSPNLGLVQFLPGDTAHPTPTVRQDLYWCPPWQPDSLVVSWFETALMPDAVDAPQPQ